MRLGFCHSVIIQWLIPSLPSTAAIVTFTVTPFYIVLARTPDRWPRTLAPVSNEGHAYVKNQQHVTARVLCGGNWPSHLTRAGKTLRQQWNPGRGPRLSRRHLTCITKADVPLLDYTFLLPSTHLPTIMKASSRYWKQQYLTVRCTHHLVEEHECINFEHGWPQRETTDHGSVTATHSDKRIHYGFAAQKGILEWM